MLTCNFCTYFEIPIQILIEERTYKYIWRNETADGMAYFLPEQEAHCPGYEPDAAVKGSAGKAYMNSTVPVQVPVSMAASGELFS